MGDVARMLERLDLEQIDPNRFQGASPQEGRKQVFGGQVAAQALAAAARTVRGRLAHSLHGYFLRRGDPTQPIFYDVDRIRDGRSFTTRRVVAEQGGKAIFSLAASFQTEEAGYSHQAEMPAAPMPHTVPPNEERLLTAIEQTGDPMLRFLARLERPIAIHDLDPQDPRNPHVRSEPHLVWMRARDPLPDDAATHQCVLTFASDMTLLGASLGRHGLTWFDPELHVASLDHAIWFHRPFRADEWMLYITQSPSAFGARGMNMGAIYAEDGTLIASVAQESLMRRGSKAR